MRAFIVIACIAILVGVTGCADMASEPQEDAVPDNVSQVSEVLPMDGTDRLPSDSEPEAKNQVPGSVIPAVMIDGTIYYLSQGPNLSDQEVDDTQVRYTESEVSLNTFPEKDGESNYAPAGTPYVKYENGYALKIDQYGWTLFLTWGDRSKIE